MSHFAGILETKHQEQCIDEKFREIGNFHLEDIVTPINVQKYQHYYQASGFDSEKSKVLLDGFRHSFDIMYREPLYHRNTA